MSNNANHYDTRADEDRDLRGVEETGTQPDRRTPAEQIQGRRKIT